MSGRLGRLVIAVTERRWVRRLFTETRPGKGLAHRFVAGDDLAQAITLTRRLNESGMTVSLDHLGEHVTSTDEAESARDDYLACLEAIGAAGLDASISIKLSQLGLGLDDELAAESLDTLAKHARAVGTTVTVDMEESRYTEATIKLYEHAQRRHGNLGIALQSYLHRTRADLRRLSPLGGHIRMCKGAYDEDVAVALQDKNAISRAFDDYVRELMTDAGIKTAIASHDLARIEHAKKLAATTYGPFEFQMLYGVREPLQRELVDAGYPLRIYVPYGTAWYPYLTRRIAERPANLWFFLRALFGRR